MMTQQNERQSVHRLPDIVHHLPQPFQHCLHGVLTVGDVVQITLGYLEAVWGATFRLPVETLPGSSNDVFFSVIQ